MQIINGILINHRSTIQLLIKTKLIKVKKKLKLELNVSANIHNFFMQMYLTGFDLLLKFAMF